MSVLCKPPLKKRKKLRKLEEAQQVEGCEPIAKKTRIPGKSSKSGIFPREHIGSPFCDSRVYIPTVKDFMANAEEGSMLDEVSLLPLEDLASLVCGSTVYSLIKNTTIGIDLTKCCQELQERHTLLDLAHLCAYANETLQRMKSGHRNLQGNREKGFGQETNTQASSS
ncbi:hypothetical protein COOONC_15389 [Cooperia oncophora]